MIKEKNKKKKDKEQEEGEEIPLKVMNEIRRSNRMEPLTKEQHNKRKALIKANRQWDTDSQSDQMERLNQKDHSDTQLPSGANSVSAADREKTEAERKNLESTKNSQRSANEEYLLEKAARENDNQTGKNANLSSNCSFSTGKKKQLDQSPLKEQLNQSHAEGAIRPNGTIRPNGAIRHASGL